MRGNHALALATALICVPVASRASETPTPAAFAVPAHGGATTDRVGFAGGVWDTLCMHSSYALDHATHLFAEGSLVFSGIALADNVGGPPGVITLGLQRTF
jgi:hypothetical protein